MNLEEIHKRAIYNRKALEDSEVAGCFFCLRIFRSVDIIEWVDQKQTALCPHCGINSLLPDIDDLEILEKMNERWFTGGRKL